MSVLLLVMRLGDHDVIGRLGDDGQCFMVDDDSNGAPRHVERRLALRRAWHALVHASGHLAVDRERVAAMPQIAARTCEAYDAAGGKVLRVHRLKPRMDVRARARE